MTPPGIIDRLREELVRYDQTVGAWAAANSTDVPPSAHDAQRHGERVEVHAHQLADLVRVLITEVDGASVPRCGTCRGEVEKEGERWRHTSRLLDAACLQGSFPSHIV